MKTDTWYGDRNSAPKAGAPAPHYGSTSAQYALRSYRTFQDNDSAFPEALSDPSIDHQRGGGGRPGPDRRSSAAKRRFRGLLGRGSLVQKLEERSFGMHGTIVFSKENMERLF